MRIVITGAGGLLGSEVVAQARSRGHATIGLTRSELDVTDGPLVRRTLVEQGPEAVIHCAAYTAVDRAESEPEVARTVNRDGARNVAEAATECGASLVYISTDYVFDGRKRSPYAPTDETGPLSVYGRTKLEGERAVAELAPASLVVRTSWLYGGSNGFVPAILRRAAKGEGLRVVDDQRGRPTWAPHAAGAVLALLERGARGVWHAAGGGECTWLELAREAVRLRGLEVAIEPVSTVEFGSPARRPAYSVLDLSATEELLGRPMPHWKDGLMHFVRAARASHVEG